MEAKPIERLRLKRLFNKHLVFEIIAFSNFSKDVIPIVGFLSRTFRFGLIHNYNIFKIIVSRNDEVDLNHESKLFHIASEGCDQCVVNIDYLRTIEDMNALIRFRETLNIKRLYVNRVTLPVISP